MNLSWNHNHTLVVLSFFSFFSLSTARAVFPGELHPGLEAYLGTLPGGATVSVIVHLKEQADIRSMNLELKKENASRAARHERIVMVLKETAIRTQPSLMNHLEREKAERKVVGYTAHWISNLIVVLASGETIRELADHPAVDFIEPNFGFALIGSVSPADLSGNDRAGITSGLEAINADRVWHELGITGAGRIVATLDTGVDGNHPALASRWRGIQAGVDPSEAWLDLVNGGTDFPGDHPLGHGTHVMGTLTGLGTSTGDTIGVAPGAQWIACNAVDQYTGPDFDNDIITAYEWFVDPDGDPGTVDDVPDVIENSWGVFEYFWSEPPYTDCDSRWWSVIDNCEAAGIVLVFSAGNDGPRTESLASPADRAETPYNCFSVGAVNAAGYDFPYPIWENSSRGPSGCDHASVKPEVCAPGVKIYSSVPGGDYELRNGTSHAGPHVAGVVALMREVRPNLDVDEIKEILMATAHDFGTPGDDNDYGMGFIDAYQAVLTVMQPVRVYVPDDYATIQEAILFSVRGDTVVVRPGTYTENIDFLGKAIVVRSEEGPGVTIIDGGRAGSVVTFQSGEDSTSVLDGFTVTNGMAGEGGGIRCVDSSPRISRNTVIGNEAAGGAGGGILCACTATPCSYTPVLTNNIIADNTAGSGGGIYCSSGATIVNNTVSGNRADSGGGLYGYDAAIGVLNTIFRGNDAETGPEISIGHISQLAIAFSEVEGGQSSTHSDSGSTLDWGDGMIDADPLFRNAENYDFRLMAVACGDSSDSPCIDAGDPMVADLLLDCDHGLGTNRSDMGAYGGQGEGPQVSIGDEGEGPGALPLPRGCGLSQNYPNPFNPSTTMAFDIAGTADAMQDVSLVVYDLRGRRVRVLIDTVLQPGSHEIHWDGLDDRGEAVPSGIYLVRLKTEGVAYTRKMNILK